MFSFNFSGMPILNMQVYSFSFLFFSFQLPTNFLKSVLLYDNLVLRLIYFFFQLLPLIWYLYFSYISIVFPKTELFISLKKYFSNSLFASFLSQVFMSIYGFNHVSCIIELLYVFNACFKSLIWTTFFLFLCSISQTSFSTFSNFFLSGKNDIYQWRLNNFFSFCQKW